MKFQKGMPRPPNAGRKKGSLNKKKLKKVSELVAEADLNPVQEIINLIQHGDMKDKDRGDLWFQLLSYCQAKPKETEVDPLDEAEDLLESFENVTDAALLKLVKKPDGAS